MQLWSVAPWVVIRRGLIRAGVKVLWRERWLASDVALVPLDARALRRVGLRLASARAGAEVGDGRFVLLRVWVSLRPEWVRRPVRPLWPACWVVRENSGAGTEEPSPAPSRAAGEAEAARSSAGEAPETRAALVAARPWVVDVRAVLRRAGFELPSPYRLVAVSLRAAHREDFAEVKLQTAALERRIDAFEKARVA